jgi:hypothetical protein
VLAEPVQTVMRRHGLPEPLRAPEGLHPRPADDARADAGLHRRPGELPPKSAAAAGDDAGQLHRRGGDAGARWRRGHDDSAQEQIARAAAATRRCCASGWTPSRRAFPAPGAGDAARIFDFCAAIVDATKDLVIAFKPQIAYFAAHRAEDQLERLMAHIRRVAPEVPVILDAKRGDIGATAEQYAREAFERYQADAVTLSPFMGFDSIEPYLRYDRQGPVPAVPHLQPRRRRPAGAAPGRAGEPAVRAHRPPGGRPLEPQRPARPGGGRHLPGRDRACANWRRRCRC